LERIREASDVGKTKKEKVDFYSNIMIGGIIHYVAICENISQKAEELKDAMEKEKPKPKK